MDFKGSFPDGVDDLLKKTKVQFDLLATTYPEAKFHITRVYGINPALEITISIPVGGTSGRSQSEGIEHLLAILDDTPYMTQDSERWDLDKEKTEQKFEPDTVSVLAIYNQTK